MNQKVIILTSMFLCLSYATVNAQTSSGSLAAEGLGRSLYADATQLWRLTDNAAGLSLDASENRGIVYFEAQHREGDYHRVQEGGMANQLEFYTERYQKISPILVGYGSFRFDMDHTKDRTWCDVMRPYNANPFFPGSSVNGAYDTQKFDLSAAIGTIQLWGLTAGVRIDYKAGDLSRLRDPRSRSELLDYKVTPALTYTSGACTIGLAGHYNRRKEKIPNVNTVQQDPNLKYYLMSGMEQAVSTVGGYSGYSREWVDHRFGAELSYGHRANQLNSLTSLSIERGSEDVLGQYKQEPGHYTSYRYGVATRNRLAGDNTLHMLDIQVSYEEAFANEYRQQLIQERDAEKGYTSYRYETQITFKKRYQVKQLNANIHYRYAVTDNQSISRYIGLEASMNNAKNKHLLPTSNSEYAYTDFTLEGGFPLSGHHLWIEADAGYQVSNKAELNLSNPSTDYATAVLLPDLPYYEANFWHGHLQMTFQFPVKLKGTRTLWFVRAFGDYLKTDNSMSRSTIGLSLGLFN